jgi:hypothetical protein
MRVDNVIVGLMEAGDLHVCLIDSSTGGRCPQTRLRDHDDHAENPPRWRKLLLAAPPWHRCPTGVGAPAGGVGPALR